MIISKEIVPSLKGKVVTKLEYTELEANFTKMFKDTWKSKFKSFNDKAGIYIDVQNGDFKSESERDFVKFLALKPVMLVSYIGKGGLVEYLNIPLSESDLFNWYRYDDVLEVLNSASKDKLNSNLLYAFNNNKVSETKTSWDLKKVFPCASYHSWFEKFKKSSKREKLVTSQAVFSNLPIKINGIAIDRSPLDYNKIDLSEYRKNEILNDYIRKFPEVEKMLFTLNTPRTAFVDIETNVGALDSLLAVYDDEKNEYYKSYSEDKRWYDIGAEKEKEPVEDKEKKKGEKKIFKKKNNNALGTSIWEENEDTATFIDEDSEEEDLQFSKPDEPFQPINTIAVSIYPNVYVVSRDKGLSQKSIEAIEERINTYVKPIMKNREPYKFNFLTFETEVEVLEWFFENVPKSVGAITGWNFTGYDWAYMVNRYLRIVKYYMRYITAERKNNLVNQRQYEIAPYRINKNVERYLLLKLLTNGVLTRNDYVGALMTLVSPTHTSFTKKFIPLSIKEEPYNLYLPNHLLLYDYKEIYAKWDRSVPIKENLKLDWNAGVILGVAKLPHTLGFNEFYKEKFDEYVAYNAIDTILVEQIDNKIRSSNLFYSLTNVTKVEPRHTMSPVITTSVVICNFIYDSNWVITNRVLNNYSSSEEDEEVQEVPEEKFKGAYVFPVVPGVYENVCSYDFASLYPSVMRQFNISPDTLRGEVKGIRSGDNPLIDLDAGVLFDPESVKDAYKRFGKEILDNEIYTVSGAYFDNTFEGFIPRMLTEFYQKRKASKKVMSTAIHNIAELSKIYEERFGTKIDY